MIFDAIALIVLSGMMLVPLINIVVGLIVGAWLAGPAGALVGLALAILIAAIEKWAGDRLEWFKKNTTTALDGVAITERNPARGCFVKVLDKPHLDLTTPLGRGLIALLSAMAEDERQRIVKRARIGLDAARERGAKFGRKPKLTTHQRVEALRWLEAGETARALGRSYDVHHATISKLR